MVLSRKCLVVAAVTAFGVLFDAVPALRAANLDDGFLKGGNSAKIRDYLKNHGYRNVGILRFEVKKGKAAPSMIVGKMNHLVALRLENALILVSDMEQPIGITRNAGSIADAKDKTANWHTAEGRKKLFNNKYPLAWGSEHVSVDAFLTGTVEVSADYKETKVIVKIFDKKDPDLRQVGTSLSVATDREALREMGEGFVISKKSLEGYAKEGDISEVEVDSQVMAAASTPLDAVKKMKEYLNFEILIDDKSAKIKAEDDVAAIDAPSPDQRVQIKLTAKEKLGLLLRVNGVNTLNKERDERPRSEAKWWILDLGKEYTLHGFYKDGMVSPFERAAKVEVHESELGTNQQKKGIISFEIFKPVPRLASGNERSIRSRRTSSLTSVTKMGGTLMNLQKAIRSYQFKSTYYDPSLPHTPLPLPEDMDRIEFSNLSVFIGGCDIRYQLK